MFLTMARRRKILKIPFLKFKINKHTLFNTIGFIIIAVSLILLLSFTQKGDILVIVNTLLIRSFGRVSVLFPIVIFLFGTHFFNTKRLKIIKPTVTLGSALIFIAFSGFSQGGQYGSLILNNLRQDFSLAGAVTILTITLIIGILLFFNTSIETFLLLTVNIFKNIAKTIKNNTPLPSVSEKNLKKKTISEEQFIQDKKIIPVAPTPLIITPKPVLRHPVAINRSSLNIRELPKDSHTSWVYPPISLLSHIIQKQADRGDVRKNSDTIEKTLDSFGIRARVSEVNQGPTVTQYAIEIVRGTKLSKITALSNDLALALAASTGQVRIEAPIPGRSIVGIEIPNKTPEIVTFKKLLSSPEFTNNPHPLLVPLGLDVSGKPIATSINKMPHVLIAGTTGAGKSVLLNTWICSFLFRAKPEEVRLLLVDPKRVELTLYNRIPHLLTEVIVEPDKIISALKWTVSEMDNRYKLFQQSAVRNIDGYNELGLQKIPYIILIIDELADLMTFAAAEVEGLITRIAQMARATGIHLILATQRPSVDVITGLMKANIPARIAFNVASMIDSRVVLDMPGAEKLLGKGDMLFLPPDQAKPRRIQGPFITEKDVSSTVAFLRQHSPEVQYTEEVTTRDVSSTPQKSGATLNTDEKDSLFSKALELVSQYDKASASLLQRRFSIGYNRAARILDQLEAEGYIGHSEGQKPREVIRRQTPQEQEDTHTT